MKKMRGEEGWRRWRLEQKVSEIIKDVVREALKRMKNGKPVGPDDRLVQVWKCLGERASSRVFDQTVQHDPTEWRKIMLVLIFKKNTDVQSCNNYRMTDCDVERVALYLCGFGESR